MTGRQSADPVVSVQGVSKSFRVYHDRNQSLKAAILRRKRATYEEFWALDDVTLQIPEGGTFGLMGHNGSGKSTLLKCIAKILQPNKGTITSRGRMAAMLEVGSGFHPELSGLENIYLNGSILGMSKQQIDANLDAIVDFAGVGNFIDQPVKNYSSGMYVRLGFSVAIHVDPDILLVDEILAVGDMQFQEKCKEKFAEFKEQGRTIIVVSHALGDMRSFCDQIAWLDHGRVVEVGPAAATIDKYIEDGHLARPVATGGARHGSGEIIVERIEMLDADGQDARHFRTGDELTLRLYYKATQPVRRPVFSASITNTDGVLAWTHHASDARFVPDELSGSGSVDVHIPAMPLQPGSFDLHSSVVDESLSHSYDQYMRAIRFDVAVGVPRESGGLVSMNSRWENLTPPTRMKWFVDASGPGEPLPWDRSAVLIKDWLAKVEASGKTQDEVTAEHSWDELGPAELTTTDDQGDRVGS
ncbi:ABC transporter ATP-binding protein [Nakamurella sp.]|uniref:ABC transporter ATP-binding protein n=1 Tax=Nakamurella sp. TaxID=1869182 RepID=UPI0037830EF4